jgi:hypothetical protein
LLLMSPSSDARLAHTAACLRAAPVVTIYQGSTVTPRDELRPGTPVTCVERPELAPLLHALALVPAAMRPKRVVVHTDLRSTPGARPLDGVAYHRPSRTFLLGHGRASLLDETIWLHELAHAALDGARPGGPVARRLLGALEEGVADYFAAALSGSAQVGSARAGEIRDLSLAWRAPAWDWAALAVPGAFSPHRFGKSLAAALFRLQPTPGALLEDLVVCLHGRQPWRASDAPQALLLELIQRCPVRSQQAVRSVLGDWLPRELFSP